MYKRDIKNSQGSEILFFFSFKEIKVHQSENSIGIGTYRLKLDTRHNLDLLKTFYIPSLSRNLVSLSKLDVTGYSFNFGN